MVRSSAQAPIHTGGGALGGPQAPGRKRAERRRCLLLPPLHSVACRHGPGRLAVAAGATQAL